MKLKEKNTVMTMRVEETESSIGLKNDIWLNVNYSIKTDDYFYEIERKSLAKSEYENTIEGMIDFYKNPSKTRKTFRFIKNYFKIDMYLNKKNEVELKFELIGDNKKNSYVVYMRNEEINDFIKMSVDAKVEK